MFVHKKKIFAAFAIAAITIRAAVAYAHGTVGDYTFLEPMVAEDANPKNEFDILRPSWVRTSEGREFSLGFSLEKKLSENSSILIGNEWLEQSPKEGPYARGFNNIELLPKYAFFTSPEHELRFSAGLKMEIPTGDRDVGAESHFRMGPELLWAKGMGDLPNSCAFLKYLRPIGFQGDLGYTANTTGRAVHDLFADEVIEYSLPYLSNSVRDIGLPWPLRNMYLYTEFNYDQLLAGPAGQTFPDIRITPGIAFMNRYIELSVATQFPLNNATVPNNHAAVLGLLDLFIDDLIPQTNWTPFK
jgi:hypothetical protein